MTWLVLGLVIFLGAHSVRIVGEDWRAKQIARRGENGWKGLYSLVSIVGFVLIVWGYGQARLAGADLWHPPVWTRHTALLLTLVSFVLLAAAYVPGTRIKAAIKHPMVVGVKVWAFAHLISNGRLADIVLFGAFLLWAVLDFRAARRRDRATGITYAPGGLARDVVAVVAGVVAWVVFARWLHAPLSGVAPLG